MNLSTAIIVATVFPLKFWLSPLLGSDPILICGIMFHYSLSSAFLKMPV